MQELLPTPCDLCHFVLTLFSLTRLINASNQKENLSFHNAKFPIAHYWAIDSMEILLSPWAWLWMSLLDLSSQCTSDEKDNLTLHPMLFVVKVKHGHKIQKWDPSKGRQAGSTLPYATTVRCRKKTLCIVISGIMVWHELGCMVKGGG